MGVVYSPEEVAAGHVAKPGDQVALGKELIYLAQTQESIAAIQVYGSTALGSASLRSDMDGLVIYNDGEMMMAIEAIKTMNQAAREAGNYAKAEIHLEPTTPWKRSTRLGNREYLAHFRQIYQQYPQWAVNNPARYLDTTPVTSEEYLFDAVNALEAKTEKFTKAYLQPEIDYSALQRALELPVAVARKVQHVTELHTLPKPPEHKGSMRELGSAILQSLQGRYPSAKSALALHSNLQTFDAMYTEKLDEVVRTGGIEGYADYLHGNKGVILKTAIELSSIWQEILMKL